MRLAIASPPDPPAHLRRDRELLRPMRVHAAGPSLLGFGEAAAAAAFITVLSLLVTGLFAPLFALASTTQQLTVMMLVAMRCMLIPPLLLRRTSPPAVRSP